MIVDHMRAPDRSLPEVNPPGDVDAMRIWHCRCRSLTSLARYRQLTTLVVATWPDDSLDVLSELTELRYLSVVHLPRVRSLEPLGDLTRLGTLRLATLPSWDSSGKTTTVSSLAPLGRLDRLRHVELFGVIPDDGSLEPLLQCQMLESVRLSKYPDHARRRFYETAEVTDNFAPGPPVEGW